MSRVDETNHEENIRCLKLPYVMMKDILGKC